MTHPNQNLSEEQIKDALSWANEWLALPGPEDRFNLIARALLQLHEENERLKKEIGK